MSSQAGPVAAGLADREGARLVARPDVVSQRRPGQGRRSHFGDIMAVPASGADFRSGFCGNPVFLRHRHAIVTLQSGEVLHMGVNATRFPCRQLGLPRRTSRLTGMLAAAAGACNTGLKRRTGPRC